MDNQENLKLKKLLYVDDDLMALESIQQLLRKEYDIHIAQTPGKALELIEKNKYDAILMDIGLRGELNGIELTQIMKKDYNYAEIPFIAITAYASRRDMEYFLSNGLDYYISKPFFKKDIIKLLDTVFEDLEKKNNK